MEIKYKMKNYVICVTIDVINVFNIIRNEFIIVHKFNYSDNLLLLKLISTKLSQFPNVKGKHSI
jgi:hypothetical protein